MKKVKLALVGAGGYGDYCLGLMERFVDPETYALVAAIDPFYERVPRFEKLKAEGVPFYRTLEDFFAVDTADLVLIASPIHMHREQCMLAMQHGAHVLCEKPLAPIVQDALAIRDAAAKYGKKLGVGFQMSFCDPIQNLKKDIRAGLLGAPKSLRSYVSWQRFDSYYNSQMALLEEHPEFDIFEDDMRIFSNSNISPPHYVGRNGEVERSLVCNGCIVLGKVKDSILSSDVYVGEGAVVEKSILLPGVRVEANARVFQAIVGEGSVIEMGACFCGGTDQERIALLGDSEHFKSL